MDNNWKACIGKEVLCAILYDDYNGFDNGCVKVDFTDGTSLILADDDRQCCESRYIKTEDNLSSMSSEVLVGVTIGEHLCNDDDAYGREEQVFIHIDTNKDRYTLCCYNDHNGYYGGFNLVTAVILSYNGETND